MDIVLISVITLAAIGVIAAIVLYYLAQKFKVEEDPRIDEVEEVLPAANCGGCGYPGCRQFAEACVRADSLDGLFCPVGGNDVMKKVAEILGKDVVEQEPKVAVVRCQGSPKYRPRTTEYEGPISCAVEAALGSGHTDCQYGCLGHGDCVAACEFDAMYMDPETQLPVIIEDKCTACGACVEACPKDIIELRPINRKSRRVYVSCVSMDKGATTRKACEVGCIGCAACYKACEFDAINMLDAAGNVLEEKDFRNATLAYIIADKCRLCRACVPVCPTDSIIEINFPPRKVRIRKSSSNAAAKAKAKTSATQKTTQSDVIQADVKVKDNLVNRPVENPEKQQNNNSQDNTDNNTNSGQTKN